METERKSDWRPGGPPARGGRARGPAARRPAHRRGAAAVRGRAPAGRHGGARRRIGGRWVVGEPKTEAGRRTVTLPAAIAAALEQHLKKRVASSPEALL